MKRPEDNPQGIPGQNPGYSPTPPFEGPYAVNMPPSWPGPQGQMGGYPPPYHGFYRMPYGIPPQPWQTPPAGAPQDAVEAQAGLSAALGDMAEKNGLGMFKDFLNFEDGDFWKGAVVGAAVVLLIGALNMHDLFSKKVI